MTTPIQLTFRHVQPSPAVAARVRTATRGLEKFYRRITACHVVIEAVQRHQHRRNPYNVRIELSVPGERIVVGHRPAHRPTELRTNGSAKEERLSPAARHKDLYVAIHDSFDIMRRRLEEFARQQRGDTKSHGKNGKE